MTTTSKAVATVQFPIAGLLGIAFVVLKLCGVIAWSWWWVVSPFWLPVAVVAGVFLALLLLVGLACGFRGLFPRKPHGNPYAQRSA